MISFDLWVFPQTICLKINNNKKSNDNIIIIFTSFIYILLKFYLEKNDIFIILFYTLLFFYSYFYCRTYNLVFMANFFFYPASSVECDHLDIEELLLM